MSNTKIGVFLKGIGGIIIILGIIVGVITIFSDEKNSASQGLILIITSVVSGTLLLGFGEVVEQIQKVNDNLDEISKTQDKILSSKK